MLGTKEWAELASFVFDGSAEVNAAIDTVMNSGYGITQEDVDTLGEGLNSGTLTRGQQRLISEVVALRSEALFGSEQAIAKLTKENRTLAEKILDRIKAFLDVFKAKTPEEKAEVKRLQEAQRLFERALGKAGTKYAAEELTRMNAKNMQVSEENSGESVDEKRKVQYNYKELYTSTDEYIREVHSKDRETFNRWLANKTSNMADDEIRSVAIYCAQRAYFFEADGYMHGHMLRTVSSKHSNVIKRMIEEQENDIHNDAKIAALWFDAVSDQQRGKTDGNDVFADRGRTTANDRIFDQTTASNGTRNSQRSGENYQIDNDEVERIIKGLREMLAKMDEKPERQYSRKFLGARDVAYTEEQYRDFGWVRDNDVIPAGAWEDFTSKFAKALSGRENPPKTKGGEYMIAVSDIYDTQKEGINNVVVYATGSIDSPQVSRVLTIDLDNETELDRKRREIYDFERRGIQQKAGGICRLYYAPAYGNQHNGQSKSRESIRNSGQLGAVRERSSKTTDRIKEFKVNDDGSFTTVYADGRTEVKYSRKQTGETVTLSKGELAKLHANYAGEKVFARQSVVAAVKKIDAFEKLTGKQRNEFINRLWKGYNERLHQQGFEQFTDFTEQGKFPPRIFYNRHFYTKCKFCIK